MNKFNGVWAFASMIKQELLFLRDRLGKKPLYYYAKKISSYLVWVKTITQYKQFVKEIDKTAIEFYFLWDLSFSTFHL